MNTKLLPLILLLALLFLFSACSNVKPIAWTKEERYCNQNSASYDKEICHKIALGKCDCDIAGRGGR